MGKEAQMKIQETSFQQQKKTNNMELVAECWHRLPRAAVVSPCLGDPQNQASPEHSG